MARVDGAGASDAWVKGLQGATQKIKDGISRVQVAPGQAAARAADLWEQNVANAKDKYKANVAAVTKEQWQDAAINKGAGRVASGALAAQSKFESFMDKFLPAVDAAVRGLPARGDIEQNLQRSNQLARELHKFKNH